MTASLLLQHYATWVPYLSIVCVLGYIVGFAIGPGPVPWIWNNEFFRQSARGPAGCKFLWESFCIIFFLIFISFFFDEKMQPLPKVNLS